MLRSRLPLDHVSRWIEAGVGIARVHLEGEAEDALRAVQPIHRITRRGVQIAGLLRDVAVRRGHVARELTECCQIIEGHVRGQIVIRVTVGVEDQFGVGVESDRRCNVPVRQHEVAHDLGLRLGEGSRAAIGVVVGPAGRSRAAPTVAVVAVQIHAEGAIGVGAAILAPGLVDARRNVVLPAVRVDVRQHPDLARVHQVGQRRDRGRSPR